MDPSGVEPLTFSGPPFTWHEGSSRRRPEPSAEPLVIQGRQLARGKVGLRQQPAGFRWSELRLVARAVSLEVVNE